MTTLVVCPSASSVGITPSRCKSPRSCDRLRLDRGIQTACRLGTSFRSHIGFRLTRMTSAKARRSATTSRPAATARFRPRICSCSKPLRSCRVRLARPAPASRPGRQRPPVEAKFQETRNDPPGLPGARRALSRQRPPERHSPRPRACLPLPPRRCASPSRKQHR